MPCEGGAAVPVPRNGGLVAFESPDGKWLYYIRPDDSPSLWKMAAGGGEEAQIVPLVQARTFAVTAAGIYFIAPPKHGSEGSIDFISFAANAPKTLLPLTRPPCLGLTVSPDNRSLLIGHATEPGACACSDCQRYLRVRSVLLEIFSEPEPQPVQQLNAVPMAA